MSTSDLDENLKCIFWWIQMNVKKKYGNWVNAFIRIKMKFMDCEKKSHGKN